MRNMDELDVDTTFLNPRINDDTIYMTLSEGWLDGLNGPDIIVRPGKVLDGLKLALQLWHKDSNDFLLTLVFTPSSADPAHQFLGIIIHH